MTMRAAALATLVACIALGACRTTSESESATEASTPPAASTEAAPATQPRRGNAAARATSAPASPPPERDPQYTPEQRTLMIRQICWGQVDRQRQLRGDDARLAWINKCIADKSKEPLIQPASQ